MQLTPNLRTKYSYSNKAHKNVKRYKIINYELFYIYKLKINPRKRLYFNIKYYWN